MKLQIGFRFFMVCLTTALSITVCRGQGASTSNPGEYLAIMEGESLINGRISSQNNSRENEAGIQSELSHSTTQIKNWEQQYNSYLKTTEGFANGIVACCQLYLEGVQTLTALWEVHTAQKINRQGVFATMSMNNLYMETAIQFIKTYRSLKKVCKQGGKNNMLNSAERTALIWSLERDLEHLNQKLRRLAVSISVFSFEDVWNRAIAGKIDKSNGMLAIEARNRMRRAATSVAKYYRLRQNTKPWGSKQ